MNLKIFTVMHFLPSEYDTRLQKMSWPSKVTLNDNIIT